MSKNRLKDIREDRDFEQKEIAKELGISQQYYSRYELEQVELPMRHYKKLAKFYNVSIDYLAGIIDYPKPLKDTTKKELTAKQLALLEAYETKKEFQKTIDKILDIGE